MMVVVHSTKHTNRQTEKKRQRKPLSKNTINSVLGLHQSVEWVGDGLKMGKFQQPVLNGSNKRLPEEIKRKKELKWTIQRRTVRAGSPDSTVNELANSHRSYSPFKQSIATDQWLIDRVD